MTKLPVIGITMGDPAGIGPEIIIKALKDQNLYEMCSPVILGDPSILALSGSKCLRDPELNLIRKPNEAISSPKRLNLIKISDINNSDFHPGKPTIAGGLAMVQYILHAVELTQKGKLDAIVTCPISKSLMHQAGYTFDGHTELLAHLTNTSEYMMMLAGDRLRVTLATIHCALKKVPLILDIPKVYQTIVMTAEALLKDFALKDPHLAVAALNPHAGEGGLFGSEEDEIITPAIRKAQSKGFRVSGPYPPDTIFVKAASGEFDAVVAMYHDQGLIPLKLLHFSDAVNITLGLPIIRTSVDHGTAYDIAGKGQADPSSLIAAIKMAVMIVKNRQ